MDDVARTELLHALRRRLAEVPDAASRSDAVTATDPEETLRKLMVAVFPGIRRRGYPSAGLADASLLLCSIAHAARSDLRFLDAFNQYYEINGNDAALIRDAGGSAALTAYRSVLEGVIEGLQSGVCPSIVERCSPDHERELAPVPDGPPRRVLVLADHPLVAARILVPVARVPQLELSVLICDARGSTPYFLLRQLRHFARALRAQGLDFLRAATRSQWKFSHGAVTSESVLTWIRKGRFDVGLHGMGVIYRRPLLDAFRLGVLNAHIGRLPSFRGRSVMEWSVLAGHPVGVTVFFIDEGIDTGERIVAWQEAPRPYPASLDALKAKLFSMDGSMYACGLRDMQREGFRFCRNVLSQGRRYYVMSELLRSVAARVLAGRESGRTENELQHAT